MKKRVRFSRLSSKFKSDVSVIKPWEKNAIFIRELGVLFKKNPLYLDGFKSTDSYLRSDLLASLTIYMVPLVFS